MNHSTRQNRGRLQVVDRGVIELCAPISWLKQGPSRIYFRNLLLLVFCLYGTLKLIDPHASGMKKKVHTPLDGQTQTIVEVSSSVQNKLPA